MRRGIVDLPLHVGRVPPWLFQKMTRLARAITLVVVEEWGVDEMLYRLSDPFWFQAFGCVLGFDWHSSGVTTTVCGALKEGIRDIGGEIGLYAAGGKGATSRKTPSEIKNLGDRLSIDPSILIKASRLSAKVDSSALQDGYQLYHHSFFFTKDGRWAVVQQGMNNENRYARRYHWLGTKVSDFVNEPHSAICCDTKGNNILNMVDNESKETRDIVTELSQESPDTLVSKIKRLQSFHLSSHHYVSINDINPERLYKIFVKTYENQAIDFKGLLEIEGVGPKTIRALALISELVYGAKPSFNDPVRYSFAHGGKDGHPYPVDRKTYKESIHILEKAISSAKFGQRDKLYALRRLSGINRE